MQGMFSSLYDVTEIEGIEYLNTENVTDMSNMFYECESLTSLDLTKFNTNQVTNMNGMFYSCNNLTTIYCNDNWAKDGLSDMEMFNGCHNLVGAVAFTDSYIDDSSMANPNTGYFTWKRLRGDVNGDNKVDVADVTAMVNLIKNGSYSSAADLDGSGTLTAIDITELVNIILGK